MYRSLLDRGWGAIVFVLLFAAGAIGTALPRFNVDAGTNVLLNEDDRDLEYYNVTRPYWGYDEYAIFCVHREDWFTPEAVKLLAELAERLRKAAHVKGVTSILSVPLLRNRPLGFPPIPPTLLDPRVNLAKAREELLEHTQALGNLISRDGRDLSILVYLDVPAEVLRLEPEWSRAQGRRDRARLAELETDYEASLADLKRRRTALVAEVRAVAREWSGRLPEPVRLSGISVLNINLVEHVTDDLKTFGWVSFGLFVAAFVAIYRKPRWVALPVLSCLLPVVLIVGTMAMTGKKVTVITSNLPVLLFVLMLPYTVYFVERYRERRSLSPSESNLDSTEGAARGIWTPCLYSCTTTMAGFASLLTSGINPVRTFGLMMTIGMAAGMAFVFLFLPSATRPLRAVEVAGAGASSEPRGVVRWLAKLTLGVPWAPPAAGAVLLGLSAWGITKINVETKFIDYFKPSSEVYRGLDYIDQRMGGTTPLEVMLTSGTPGFFKTEEGLAALAAAARYFDAVPEVGNVRSLKTLMDEVRRCPDLNRQKPMAVGQLEALLKMFKAEAQIREFASTDFTVSRVLVRFRETAPTLHRNNILRGLETHLEREVKPRGVEVRDTGVFRLYANMLNSLIKSQEDTFALVVAAIWSMLAVLFVRFPGLSKAESTALAVLCFALAVGITAALLPPGGGWRGLLVLVETRWVLRWIALSIAALVAAAAATALRHSRPTALGSAASSAGQALALPTLVLLPQMLPALACLGTMGLLGIPLDLVTVMIASIALGVGIDAAIQYTVRYRIELAATGGDRRAAVTRSHATIGRAIWIATTIVVAGFAVLSLSKFVPSVTFGLFTALAMVVGQFAALTLLPSLFLLFRMPRN